MAGGLDIPGYDAFVEIGRGGQAVVYKATQTKLGRDVAIKVLEPTQDEGVLRQFRREGDVMVALGQHQHLVQVFDVDVTTDGRPYIVMELCRLGSCTDRLQREGPLPITDVLRIGVAVADALAAIHGRGLLHRDVKPQNVLLSDYGPRLADLGIARPQDIGRTTMFGALTVAHASPEVLDDQDPTAASDLWSLGSTLHTLLTGRSPFAGTDTSGSGLAKLIARAMGSEPDPIERDDVPVELAAAIAWLLEKDPADRPPSADAVHEVLLEIERSHRATLAAAAPVAAPPVQHEVDDETRVRPEAPPPVVYGAPPPALLLGDDADADDTQPRAPRLLVTEPEPEPVPEPIDEPEAEAPPAIEPDDAPAASDAPTVLPFASVATDGSTTDPAPVRDGIDDEVEVEVEDDDAPADDEPDASGRGMAGIVLAAAGLVLVAILALFAVAGSGDDDVSAESELDRLIDDATTTTRTPTTRRATTTTLPATLADIANSDIVGRWGVRSAVINACDNITDCTVGNQRSLFFEMTIECPAALSCSVTIDGSSTQLERGESGGYTATVDFPDGHGFSCADVSTPGRISIIVSPSDVRFRNDAWSATTMVGFATEEALATDECSGGSESYDLNLRRVGT